MKKLTFAMQIFVLISFFPACLVAELSHEKAKPHTHTPASTKGKMLDKNNDHFTSTATTIPVAALMIK